MFDSGWQEAAPADPPGRLWSHQNPGPTLAAALDAVEALDVADDGGFDAAERLAGWEALAAWATARLLRETAAYARDRQATVRQSPGRRELEAEAVAMEIAALARVAPRTGEIRVAQALCLVERLPLTLAALETGRIALSHARVVIEQTESCTDDTARRVDVDLWDRPARDRTPTQLRETVRRIIARLDPENLRRRTEAAKQGRSVRYWADDDGATGVVALRLPADQARGVYAIIDTLARRAGDPDPGADGADGADGAAEPRTLAQKRADTARDLILDAATTGSTPCTCPHPHDGTEESDRAEESGRAGRTGRTGKADDTAPTGSAGGRASTGETGNASRTAGAGDAGAASRGGEGPGQPGEGPGQPGEEARDPVRGLRTNTGTGSGHARSPVRAEIRVTIPWETLAGHGERPAEMEGHGPLPADLARQLAADPDSIWRRLLTDPTTGIAAHLDTTKYRPPPAMADFVRSRDLTCAAPGCRVPAARCDLDHVIPYDHTHPDRQGGPGRTRADTLRPCCRRHHRLKTLTRWRCHIAKDPQGRATATLVWTSPSGHRWTVTSPALEPPPWDRDHDTENQDEPGEAA